MGPRPHRPDRTHRLPGARDSFLAGDTQRGVRVSAECPHPLWMTEDGIARCENCAVERFLDRLPLPMADQPETTPTTLHRHRPRYNLPFGWKG
ncbi:DUF6255 family natural product biosynthesis protein [Streptomyces olivoreticuli]